MSNSNNGKDPSTVDLRIAMAIIMGCRSCRAALEQAINTDMGWNCLEHGTVVFSPGTMITQLKEQLSYWSSKQPKPRQVEAMLDENRPKIVTLCGSTRFWKHFQEASLAETMAGKIVLSVGAAVASDEEHFGHLPAEEKARIKRELDDLHMWKILFSDEVLVLNVDGYVGESTRAEVLHARKLGVPLRFLERACQVCFCTESKPCITGAVYTSNSVQDGVPCHWVAEYVCSACDDLIVGGAVK